MSAKLSAAQIKSFFAANPSKKSVTPALYAQWQFSISKPESVPNTPAAAPVDSLTAYYESVQNSVHVPEEGVDY